MQFEILPNTLDSVSGDAVIVFPQTKAFTIVDKALGGQLSDVIKLEDFKNKAGKMLALNTNKKIPASRVIILGLGKKEELTLTDLRKALALFARATSGRFTSIALSLLEDNEASFGKDKVNQANVIAEGLILGDYRFNKYKSKKDEKRKDLEAIVISEDDEKTAAAIKEGVEKAQIYCQATYLARDLVNEPASLVTPTFLATIATDIAKKNPEITCTILDKAQAEKMGMGAFLGIAQAADTPPKFIHLEYHPKGKKGTQKLAIVGKGITFDSGGISIKPGDSMMTMKCDMAGAAAVLAVFSIISQIKPSFGVMGIIAATPNLISGKSLVPGDIVRAMNGKTIEVLNTDAEGRVTMADSLSYAVQKGATEIIDLATLTGACMVALGNDITGLFANNADLKNRVLQAAGVAGEKMYELPLEKTYKELNKSDVADIANIPSTRYGGAITAALFLEEFIDKKPWVHLDIAGPAFAEKPYDFGPKGGTGFGVRTLLQLLENK